MNDNSQRNLGIGIIGLAIALILFAAIGRFLADARGVDYGIFGAIIWTAALIGAFALGMLYFAQYVLPGRSSRVWPDGISMLWRHYTTAGEYYMNNLLSGRSRQRGQPQRESGIGVRREVPASFDIVKAGILQSYQVLALAISQGYSRAVGPGFIILAGNERIGKVIDLRPHVRRQPVRANTRDGIPVETTITVVFRVRQSPADYPDEDMPHPYDPEAIFHVSYAASIDIEDQLRPWQEQITPRAAAMLSQEIARYSLDTLYHADGAGIVLTDEISRKVQARLDREVAADGIEILQIAMDLFTFPDRVVDQRIRSWQADWQRQIERQAATTDAEALRRINLARARVQIELIQNITQNIKTVRRHHPHDLSEIVTLRMIEAMEEAASDATLRALIPQPVIHNLMDVSSEMLTLLNERNLADEADDD